MTETQTYTYDAEADTLTTGANLKEEEQESLRVGEEMEADQESLLAGKYKNAEDLEKAYLELQGKLGEKSEEVSEETETEEEPTEEEPDYNSNLLEEVWAKSLDNKLDKETYEKLEKMSSIDVAKLAMQQRKAFSNNEPKDFNDKDVEQIHGLVGGQENYNNMMSWAKQNVSNQEIDMFDSVMDLGNTTAAYFAVQALALKYQDQAGKDGQFITGKSPKSTNDVFKSQAEMIRAMEDERYNDDPAYRQSIMEKLERSNVNF